MGVLRECTACFQNYVFAAESAQRPEQCPWCGAYSVATVANKDGAVSCKTQNSAAVDRGQLSGARLTPTTSATRSPWRLSDAAPPQGTDRRSNADGQFQSTPSERVSNGIASLDRPLFENAKLPARDQAPSFPALAPSRFPVRRRSTPGVIWMLVGIGLGACVVLAVVAGIIPGLREKAEPSVEKSPFARAANSHDLRSASVVSASAAIELQTKEPRRVQNIEIESALTPQQQTALLRELLREELARTRDGDAPERPRPTGTRWLSDRPPPIGDAADDSPPLGLIVKNRAQAVAMPRIQTVDRVSPRTETRPEVPFEDDPAAISALTAAGIRCDKDAATGRVTRIDGSFRMTDALMPHVARLTGVIHLKLSFSDVTDSGLVSIKELTGIQELILNETRVTDAGMAHLAKLTELEKLDLEKTKVSDGCLSHLGHLKNLKHLDIRGTAVTPGQLDALKQSLPQAKIRS